MRIENWEFVRFQNQTWTPNFGIHRNHFDVRPPRAARLITITGRAVARPDFVQHHNRGSDPEPLRSSQNLTDPTDPPEYLTRCALGAGTSATSFFQYLQRVKHDMRRAITPATRSNHSGEPGKNRSQFDTPHSIAADGREHLCRRSRQLPNSGLRSRREITSPDQTRCSRSCRSSTVDGQPCADRGNQASMSGRHEPSASRQGRIKCCVPDALPGRIKSTLDGKIFGVLGRAGKQPKQFGSIHEIAALLKTNSTSPRL